MSIKAKLLIAVLGLAILPVVVLGALGFVAGKDAIETTTLNALNALTELKAKRIEFFLREKQNDLRALKRIAAIRQSLPALIDSVARSDRSPGPDATGELDSRLKPLQSLFGLDDILLLSPRFELLYASNANHAGRGLGEPLPLRNKEVFDNGASSIEILKLHRKQTPSVLITDPILAPEGGRMGYVAFEIDMSLIQELVRDNTGVGRSGFTVMGKKVQENGYVHLSAPHPQGECDPDRVVAFEPDRLVPMQEALLGRSGAGLTRSCEGTEVIAVWRHLPFLDAGLVTKVDAEEAFAPVAQLRRLSMVFSAQICMAACLVALLVARSISRPLYRLQEGAREIGRGNLAFRMGSPRKDEIGTLSRTLDAMAENLERVTASRDELDREIAERKQAESLLRQSEARFRDLFDNASDLIQSIAPDGSILLANRAWRETLGYSEEETRHLNIFDVIQPGCREHCADIFRRMMAGEEFDCIEASFQARDGTVVVLEGSANVQVENGRPVATRGIFREVTQRKKAEEKLRELDRMKSEFISTAAHELRTPLTALLGYAEFLLKPEEFGGFSPEQKGDFLAEIHERGELLAKIVDDILDVSRIETGRPIPLEKSATRMEELLAKVVARYDANCPKHRFELDLDHEGRREYSLDRNKMVQVLENLLSNATKYSPRGGTIRVSGREVETGYRVSVQDEGIGMTPEQAARVFDKFYRADCSNTAIGGLGLGMTIVRNIVEQHGGEVWLESAPAEGTCVSFTIPPPS